MRSRQIAAVAAARQPLIRTPAANTTPTTSHQGDVVRTVWSGLRIHS